MRQISIDSTRACFDLRTRACTITFTTSTPVNLPMWACQRRNSAVWPDLPTGTELAGVDVVIRVRRKA